MLMKKDHAPQDWRARTAAVGQPAITVGEVLQMAGFTNDEGQPTHKLNGLLISLSPEAMKQTRAYLELAATHQIAMATGEYGLARATAKTLESRQTPKPIDPDRIDIVWADLGKAVQALVAAGPTKNAPSRP
jgi:hypothetical protein